MFLKISVVVCFLACISALERGDLEKYGLFRVGLNLVKCSHNKNLKLDVRYIKVHFYDFKNNFSRTFPIRNAAKGILNINNLDRTRKFVMFVGGYKSHINGSTEKQMREAYKSYPNSYLIIPDHSAYTNKYGLGLKSYKRAVLHVHYIGKALGRMWANIKFGGVSPKKIHCVGHSLGGQILGHVGSTFFNITGEKISRITALDPAGPCFSNAAIEEQVRSGVAEYVEVYHCNAGALGSSETLGDVDFFMNKNGEMNPNCTAPMIPDLIFSSRAAKCNHRVCVDVWTASLKHANLFSAYSCKSYEMFKKRKCVKNVKTMAGSGHPGVATGNYYFTTAIYDLKTLA